MRAISENLITNQRSDSFFFVAFFFFFFFFFASSDFSAAFFAFSSSSISRNIWFSSYISSWVFESPARQYLSSQFFDKISISLEIEDRFLAVPRISFSICRLILSLSNLPISWEILMFRTTYFFYLGMMKITLGREVASMF